MLVCQRQTEEHEDCARDSTRWEMAVGPRPSRSGALNFLWNLLTIKYEPARSVILNFRMCPPDFALLIRAEHTTLRGRSLSPAERPREETKTTWNVARSRNVSIIFSARYLIFMKDSGISNTFGKKNSRRTAMTIPFIERAKSGTPEERASAGESVLKATLSSVSPPVNVRKFSRATRYGQEAD